MLTRIAGLTARRPRLLLLITALAVAAMAVLGVGAFGKLSGGGFDDPSAPSSRARALIDEKFGGDTNFVLLVDGAGTPAGRERGERITAGLRADDTVANVLSYWDDGGAGLLSRDGEQALVLAHVKGGDKDEGTNAEALIDTYTGTENGITVRAGGAAAVNHDVTAQVGADLAVAESIAVPLTLILLVIAFGSLVAALLPLAIGLIAILGTFAELYVLGSFTDVSVFSVNLTTALGLGLGIDYGLLLVSRFREQLAHGDSVPGAIRRTVTTAGRTIAFSAATVVAALAALLLFPPYFLRSFAYAGIGVVAVAAVSSLIVVPSLLAVLGHRVNKGRLPGSRTVRSADSRLWGRIAGTVMRRPALTALPVLAVLLLAASPLLGVTFGTPDERVLPGDAGSREVSAALRQGFTANDESALHLVTTGPVGPAELGSYAAKVSSLDGVQRVDTSAGSWRTGQRSAPAPAAAALGRPDAQRLTVISRLESKSAAARDLVGQVRGVPAPRGSEVLVGGNDARLVDSRHSIGERLPYAVVWIAATTFVLLFLFTGSVVQPLRALVLNGVSLMAAMGAMVWVFQDGHLSGLLGFTPQPMDTAMTVLMFCIAFGLSMDYEVFLTSRMKELHDAGAAPAEAVVQGLARTGRIVTMAAGLLAVSFFAFTTSEVSFIQMFGLGSGLAILVDAVAVRGVLVPAAMRLLGRGAWYAPRGLRRLHGRVGLRESAVSPDAERVPARM
ncbi:Trehalose monomycolate exporter MmpL3 [Streptomyces sp. RB5]|uniref:Trehalose monomycolate exporter MmpL3 n=1 Tax=Streptomyces smaragdinus TaxID=2585196 RepID=A0A7K0CCN4_9ACTN|nr:MMPL family transporter [Streptomyces smaragdinus]MQY10524.1 Trehalose monomycolate exporter MmpL3 [Streptomyces smaragdinus]